MERLALEGGEPVRKRPWPPRRPFGARESELLSAALESQNLFGPSGTMVRGFERGFAELYGVPHAVACSSGTAAIHIALGALDPDPGSEVITAPITDAGTVAPILFQNCVPVFADVDETLNLDPADVEAKLTDRTAAIIAVHLFGNPARVDRLADLARRHDIPLVEDCSQAHLATLDGTLCGTFGTIGCFSLQQSKHMTTGDGGVAITSDPELAHRMALFRDKGWLRRPGPRGYALLGLNYRMTELQGAVGLAQLEKVRAVVRRRTDLGRALRRRLEGVEGLRAAPTTPGATHTFWLFPIVVEGWDAAWFARALAAEGIPATSGYTGVPVYLMMEPLRERRTFGNTAHPLDGCHGGRAAHYPPGLCPQAEALLERTVTIPLHEDLCEEDIAEIARAVWKVARLAC